MAHRIDTTQYKQAHGKAPNGFGNWCTTIDGERFDRRANLSQVLDDARRLATVRGLSNATIVVLS